MRRVSSRQRLVSWDAFDATNGDDGDLSDLSEHDSERVAAGLLVTAAAVVEGGTGTEEPLVTGRKRSRGHSEQPPHLIPSYSWEVETTLATLCQDVQFTLFRFLDESSLRQLASTNCAFRSLILLTPGSKQVIWMPHLLKRGWPVQVNERLFGRLEDRLGIPTAAASVGDTDHALKTPNLPLLLSMTPAAVPTQVDVSLLDHANSSTPPATRNTILHLMQAPSSTSTHLKIVEGTNDVVTYTGPIGRGDRCVRANHPLPRPISVRRACSTSLSWTGVATTTSLLQSYRGHRSPAPGVHSVPGSLLSLLRQGARNIRGGKEQWRPFCSPYCQQNGTVNVTPRMVAYYEVDILERKTPLERQERGAFQNEDIPRTLSTPAECVAVGIATEAFRIHSRMPGWDSISFGYHGDDGGTFHASGGMNARFGPTFGAGDTVGCGIDYIARGIFFTLNGRFLGYGWKNLRPELLFNQDLYPVVGVDTNAPIRLNFGTSKPFLYDLDEFHASHERFLQPRYRFSSVPAALGGPTPAKRPAALFLRRRPSQSSLASNGSGSRSYPRRRSASIK